MLDLLLASINFYPTYAGPAIRFRRYEPGYFERGVQMRVFSGLPVSEGSEQILPGQPQPTTLVDERIHVDQVGVPSKPDWWRYAIYNAGLIAACRANPPQIIHFLSLGIFSLLHARQFRQLNIPLIYTHTMAAERSKNSFKRAYQSLTWKLPYQLMDCTVTSSTVMRQQLIDIGVTTRIEVIQNGVDVTRFQPAANGDAQRAMRRQLDLPVDVPLVLFVGSLSHRKGIDLLLEAWQTVMQAHSTARLVLLGPKYEDIRSGSTLSASETRLQKLLADFQHNERVILPGSVTNVEQYLQAADLMVFPSRREGMPNVIPEAYASGLPVLMCPFTGLPEEFGKPGEHYWPVAHQAEAIATEILHLLEQTDLRQRLRDQAFKLAHETMRVEQSLDQYVALYQDLLVK